MKHKDSHSSRHRSGNETRSLSRDRERRRRDFDRSDHGERERYRDYERGHSRHRSKSPKNYYRSHSKKAKSRKSKKYKRRNSDSSCTSYSSSDTKDSCVSSVSRSSSASHTKKPGSRSRQTPVSSTDGNTSFPTVSTKTIDLTDCKVRAELDTINEDKFVPQTFYSTRDREADKVIIDLDKETVSLSRPAKENREIDTKAEIFHPNFLGDAQQKNDRWVKKLLTYRQKRFRE